LTERLVVFTEGAGGPAYGLDEEMIRGAGGTLRCTAASSQAERIAMARLAEVMVVGTAPITRDFLSALPRLKGLVRSGIGVDAVDAAAATDLGIVLANVPDFCRQEVAEHTLALIFAVARKIARNDRSVRNGQWRGLVATQILPIYRLNGKTLGVVGMGKIGLVAAQKAQALGMKVIGFDPYLPADAAAAIGVPLLSLDELLRQADVVSLHVPLTPETKHLINERTLALMKPQSILINVARGPIVDEATLQTALESGHLAGAGLDVLEQEPPSPAHGLFKFENVVFTSHYASCSVEAYADLRRQVSEQVGEILLGKFPRNLVNREVMNLPQCRLGHKERSA
jgi:D-3-phosphoglycerate dehydrogenase / 2-oxoglutarate reductase